MAQATPSQDIAAKPKLHDAIVHQHAPTALGILGRFPSEVRNQLYRDIFHGSKAIFTSKWRQQHFPNGPKDSFGILTASKTIRAEAEPFFYPYCQFNLDVGFSQDQSQFNLAKETQHLQRKLPRMHNIVFEAIPFEFNAVLDGFIGDQVAFIPIEPQAPHNCGLVLPDIFEDRSFNGREMVFNLIFNLEFHWAFWDRITYPALQAVFIPFQRYEIVKFYIEIRIQQKSRVGDRVVGPEQFAVIGMILQDCVKTILGPGTKTNALKQVEPDVYADCMEFHPKSHFEAMARGEGLE